MKKTRTRENDAVFFMLLGLTAVFFCWRCRYGFAEADEAFYPTIAYRLTQGDRLLVDEWHMSQLSSVLLYLPVLLFTRLTGGTAGIYLALRYLLPCGSHSLSAFETLSFSGRGRRCACSCGICALRHQRAEL